MNMQDRGTVELIKSSLAEINDQVKAANSANDSRIQALEQQFASVANKSAPAAPGGLSAAIRKALDENRDGIKAAAKNRTSYSFDVDYSYGSKAVVNGTPGEFDTSLNAYPGVIQRIPRIGGDGRFAMLLSDVFPSIPGAGASFDFVQSDTSGVAADYQAGGGAAKAESAPAFEAKVGQIVTIAHHVPVSAQVVEDNPLLQQYLYDLMGYKVRLKMDRELAVGDGAANHLQGITGISSNVSTSGYTVKSEKVAALANAVVTAGFTPTHALIALNDSLTLETAKASTSGDYLVPAAGQYWGLQPLRSPSLSTGTIYVFDAGQAVIVQKGGVRITVGYVNDQFTKNMLTILAEVRAGFAILSPAAFLKTAF